MPDDQRVSIEVTGSATLEPTPPALTIAYSITNDGNHSVYVDRPRMAPLQKWIDGEWRDVYGFGRFFDMTPPDRLDPGRVINSTFSIRWTESVWPELQVNELPGTYRAEFMIGRTLQRDPHGSGGLVLGDLLPVEMRRVEFEVRSP